MSGEDSEDEKRDLIKPARTISKLVERSAVPPALPYNDYKPHLRYDFYYSCAYCTMTEAEAQAIRLVIDHYDPVSNNPALANEYANLMYACDECNTRKGDRFPPPEAQAQGIKFFRIDEELRSNHFELRGDELVGLTECGKYTIQAVDLNRLALRRLRSLRRRLSQYEGFASEGIMALAGFQIDKLQPAARQLAIDAINSILATANEVFENLDALLIDYAQSDMLVDELSDDDKKRNKERLSYLKQMEGRIPGNWRGRNRKSRTN